MPEALDVMTAEPVPAARILHVDADDGSTFDVTLLTSSARPRQLMYWLPAMGIASKHYLPLAEALAREGVAVALHEWRGIGSSSERAGRKTDWSYRDLLERDLPAGIRAAMQALPSARLWLGGHSLGGQLGSLYAGLHGEQVRGLALVASGAPYWRRFSRGALVGLFYVLAPWLARIVGHLPGRRIGFGGNEARGVIDDWARSGRTGRYAARGMSTDIEARLRSVNIPLLGLRLEDDWLAPEPSLTWLLEKMPAAQVSTDVITAAELGVRADHFGWMKAPDAVAMRLAHGLHRQEPAPGA